MQISKIQLIFIYQREYSKDFLQLFGVEQSKIGHCQSSEGQFHLMILKIFLSEYPIKRTTVSNFIYSFEKELLSKNVPKF